MRVALENDKIADIFFYISNPLANLIHNADYMFDSDSGFELNFSTRLEPKENKFFTIKLVQSEIGVKNDY